MESKNVRAKTKINAANASNDNNFLVTRSFNVLGSLRLWIVGTAITAVVMLMLFIGWAFPSEGDRERGDS